MDLPGPSGHTYLKRGVSKLSKMLAVSTDSTPGHSSFSSPRKGCPSPCCLTARPQTAIPMHTRVRMALAACLPPAYSKPLGPVRDLMSLESFCGTGSDTSNEMIEADSSNQGSKTTHAWRPLHPVGGSSPLSPSPIGLSLPSQKRQQASSPAGNVGYHSRSHLSSTLCRDHALAGCLWSVFLSTTGTKAAVAMLRLLASKPTPSLSQPRIPLQWHPS